MSYQSISGKRPEEDRRFRWTFSTGEIERFLQDKIDSTIAHFNREIPNEADRYPGIRIAVNSIRVGKKFTPLMAIIPTEVLVNYATPSDELSIFNPMESSGVAKIDKPYYMVLSSFMYTEEEAEEFTSSDFMQTMHVNRTAADRIKRYSKARIHEFGGDPCVVVMLDPIRVIHNMMRPSDAKQSRDYSIEISDAVNRHDGDYQYKVYQDFGGKKNKNKQGKKNKEIARRNHNALVNMLNGR